MGDTAIQWTGKTWNPLRARNNVTSEVGWFCEHVSEGCRNCYAEKMNRNTYFGNGLDYKPAALSEVELFLDEKILEQPLHWRKPVKVFPCSMTDLFGRWVEDEWLLKIFDVMRRCPQHTFQVLTKRAERMKDFCSRLRFDGNGAGKMWLAESAEASEGGYRLMGGNGATGMPWVWLGVSVEDQETADERIPLLLQTPAAVRWISAEPLLGPTRLKKYLSTFGCSDCVALDWVVVGGESGPSARSLDLNWIKSIVSQCQSADVPVFVKQLGYRPWWDGIGTRSPAPHIYLEPVTRNGQVGWQFDCMNHRKGGDINEWPEDLRVREYPTAKAQA